MDDRWQELLDKPIADTLRHDWAVQEATKIQTQMLARALRQREDAEEMEACSFHSAAHRRRLRQAIYDELAAAVTNMLNRASNQEK